MKCCSEKGLRNKELPLFDPTTVHISYFNPTRFATANTVYWVCVFSNSGLWTCM